MKINLEVTHSCSINRKKPWPRLAWIGKEKQQLYLLDYQRISVLDPKTGKTKRKVPKISALIKTLIAYNVSDNGVYLVGIQATGDLVVWNRDTDVLKTIAGRNDFGFKLGFHCPSVYLSDDTSKLVLVTTRNKVFVWETDRPGDFRPVTARDKLAGLIASSAAAASGSIVEGNWSDIVAPKEIKTVEDNKELVLHVRFASSPTSGTSATCCFVFNYESRLVVNVLRIKWLNSGEINSLKMCHFETLWVSYQPNSLAFSRLSFASSTPTDASLVPQSRLDCLFSRGVYVCKLSHSAELVALACNQKLVERNCLVFMSVANGTVCPVNLRSFGQRSEAKGRHYWIQDLNWMHNDLYLVGITKHGAIFLVSRLGQPLAIHAIGKDVNMGPALYITIHPLIIVRRNVASTSQAGEISLSSTIEQQDTLRQRYSIAAHPTLPVLVCSDGYLVCVLRLQSAFVTQSRLIRELMHETIGLLNSAAQDLGHAADGQLDENPFAEQSSADRSRLVRKNDGRASSSRSVDAEAGELPDWGLQAPHTAQSDRSGTDSGVEANEDGASGKNRPTTASKFGFGSQFGSNAAAGHQIAAGKIIFSSMQLIEALPSEMLKSGTVVSKLESAFESLQSSWTLFISMSTSVAARDVYECDQTARAIQQAFAHFSYLFLTVEPHILRQFEVYRHQWPAHASQSSASAAAAAEHLLGRREEEFRVQVLIDLFVRMLKFLYFDPASRHNPNSHMIIYISRFVEKFVQSLLKFDNLLPHFAASRTRLLALMFSLLNLSERLVKSVYDFRLNEAFVLNPDSMIGQARTLLPTTTSTTKATTAVAQRAVVADDEAETENPPAPENETRPAAMKEAAPAFVVRTSAPKRLVFADSLLEKCWHNLMHYARKHRRQLVSLGESALGKQIRELDMLIILLERRLDAFIPNINGELNDNDTWVPESLPFKMKKFKYESIQKQTELFRINKADLVYLDIGAMLTAVELWRLELNDLFDQIAITKTQSKSSSSASSKSAAAYSTALPRLIERSIRLAHKILYACLANYDLTTFVSIVNRYFKTSDAAYSPFSLLTSTFRSLRPPRPLQRTHLAIVCALRSLARFMALYFINCDSGSGVSRGLYVYSINTPVAMPNIIDECLANKFGSTLMARSQVKVEIDRYRLTAALNKRGGPVAKQSSSSSAALKSYPSADLTGFLTTDKTLELLLVTGLFDEAIYFSNLINDWKSSFLISSMLKESRYYADGVDSQRFATSCLPEELKFENMLSIKLCSLFGLDKTKPSSSLTSAATASTIEYNLNEFVHFSLLEKSHMENIGVILKELLLCSVMTRANIVEPLLGYMMESLVFYTGLISRSALVPADYYLPAPPVYCTQMSTIDERDLGAVVEQIRRLANDPSGVGGESSSSSRLVESYLRVKLCLLCKCMLLILNAANLTVPLVKWYLVELGEAGLQMKQTYGVRNAFKLSTSLSGLLASIRFQKLGYIPESLLFLFREFCAVLFYLDLRDKFSLVLRQYQTHLMLHESAAAAPDSNKAFITLCLQIVDYGNAMLSYRAFLPALRFVEIQDIVLSTISRLSTSTTSASMLNLELERKLARCVSRKALAELIVKEADVKISNDLIASSELFESKLAKLLDAWKRAPASKDADGLLSSMYDVYEQSAVVAERNAEARLVSVFGVGEDSLARIYTQRLPRTRPYEVGGFEFERSSWCSDFLELLFRLGFDQTENWETLTQFVNHVPLLPEFYEVIRDQQLPNDAFVDKNFLISSDGGAGAEDSLFEDMPFTSLAQKLNADAQNTDEDEDVLGDDDAGISPILTNRKRRRRIRALLSLNKTQHRQKQSSGVRDFSPRSKDFLLKAAERPSNRQKAVSTADLFKDLDYLNLNIRRRKGLFRTYSIKSLKSAAGETPSRDPPSRPNSRLRKSVSFTNLSSKNLDEDDDEAASDVELSPSKAITARGSGRGSGEEPSQFSFKVLDFGYEYVAASNLAIWLMKWSANFHKLLMTYNKTAVLFWYNDTAAATTACPGTPATTTRTAQRLQSINANMLVACVFLANGNDLESVARGHFLRAPSRQTRQPSPRSSFRVKKDSLETDDDLTEISNSLNRQLSNGGVVRSRHQASPRLERKPSTPTSVKNAAVAAVVVHQSASTGNEDSSQTSTLDISSLNDQQVQNIFGDQDHTLAHSAGGKRTPSPTRNSRSRQQQAAAAAAVAAKNQLEMSTTKSFDILQQQQMQSMIRPASSRQSPDLSNASVLEASHFYNLNAASRSGSVQASRVLNSTKVDAVVAVRPAATGQPTEVPPEQAARASSVSRSSFGNLITGLFGRNRSKSQSKSRSASPTKQIKSPPPPTDEAQQRQQHQQLVEPGFYQHQQTPAVYGQMAANQPFSVHDIIRQELKKIVQMQHDTVMNFLNGGGPAPARTLSPPPAPFGRPAGGSSLEQQLMSVISQQQHAGSGQPVEFVIETKVKAVDKFGRAANTLESVVMSSSNYNQQDGRQTLSGTHHNQPPKSLFKIPLLRSEHMSPRTPRAVSPSTGKRASSHLPFLENMQPMPFDGVRNGGATQSSHFLGHSKSKSPRRVPEPPETTTATGRKLAPGGKFPLLKFGFMESTSSTRQQTISFTLPAAAGTGEASLRSTQASREPSQGRPAEPTPSQVQITATTTTTTTTVVAPAEKDTKEVQVQKPLYDGYLIAPSAFEDMLKNNRENEKISATSAEAHYQATQYLRDADELAARTASGGGSTRRKEVCIMTDGLGNADPIAPNILFKMQFDPKRKGQDGVESAVKDFVNVVDLDGNSIDEILKLIEHEQNRRKGKFVSISSPRKKPSSSQLAERSAATLDASLVQEEVADADKSASVRLETSLRQEKSPRKRSSGGVVGGDQLTEKLLQSLRMSTEEEWKEYDEVMNKQIDYANKMAAAGVGKQRMVNELNFIDEKIRAINEMAQTMETDYGKYNKMLRTVQELGKEREMIERYQARLEVEEERQKIVHERKMSEAQLRSDQAAADSKAKKPESSRSRTPSPRKGSVAKTTTRPGEKRRSKEQLVGLVDADELSDLRDDEVARLQRMLQSASGALNLSGASTAANSITDAMRDIMDDLDIETAEDLDSDKLDALLAETVGSVASPRKRSPVKATATSPSKKKPTSRDAVPSAPGTRQIRGALASLKPAKSPIRSRKDLKQAVAAEKEVAAGNRSPVKRLNLTYEKTVSPIVRKEREMEEKRELLHDAFTKQREHEAQRLISDMLTDSAQLASLTKQDSSRSPVLAASRRTRKSKSPCKDLFKEAAPSTSPPTRLRNKSSPSPAQRARASLAHLSYDTHLSLGSNQSVSLPAKPSLMAQTIFGLEKRELRKQQEAERLLRDLELRASLMSNSSMLEQDRSKQPKTTTTIKSFASLVHLQDRSKLRSHPDHKPMTYSDQLKQYQENTVVPETVATSRSELKRVYGSRRVPGVYRGYVKQEPRETKTYSDRLKELVPSQSQVVLPPGQRRSTARIGTAKRPNPAAKTFRAKSSSRHGLQTKARPESNLRTVTRIESKQRRFVPYKSPCDGLVEKLRESGDIGGGGGDDELAELLDWKLDERTRELLYDRGSGVGPRQTPLAPARRTQIQIAQAAKHVTYKDADQDTIADVDGDEMLAELMRDEEQSDKTYARIVRDLRDLESKGVIGGHVLAADDYVDQVNVDDLKNYSLSSDSAAAANGFMDWDQIDELIRQVD